MQGGLIMDNIGTGQRGRVANMFSLVKTIKKHYSKMAFAAFCGVIKHLSTIGAAALCAYIVGLAAQGELLNVAGKLFKALGILVVLTALSNFGESFTAHDVAYRILAEFRIRLYSAVERVCPAILLNMRSGQLASTLMSDVEILEWFFAHTFTNVFVMVIVDAIILIYLGSLHWLLALIILAFQAVTLIIPFLMKKKADEQGKAVRDSLADANAVTVEGVHGMKEILTLNYKDRYREKNERYMKSLYNAQLAYGKRLGTEGSLMEIAVGLAMLTTKLATIYMVFGDLLPFELYTTIVVLSVLCFNPIIEISSMARNFGIITAAADRVYRVLETEPLVKDKGKDIDTGNLNMDVSFENVSFSYRTDKANAVENISFKIEKGETLALVGHSGAGKTTCANLLLRYWDVDKGSIKIGGTDIRDMSLKNIRGISSAVLQDVYLFNIPIKENIRLGNVNASDEDVICAAKKACAHEFIMSLPDGYDTNVGERGANLSGGQRQRIAIARAILKNSPILILDEAVSNLDTENERDIQQALKEISRNRTTLVIAHRLSTIMAADKLIVLDNEKIVQAGTHAELIEQAGLYKTLVEAQLEKETVNYAV